MKSWLFIIVLILMIAPFNLNAKDTKNMNTKKPDPNSCNSDDPIKEAPLTKDEDYWKKTLTPEQYRILRQAGTERAFTGKYWNNHDKGMYFCAACGAPLFKSDTKFDSGSGWPSFWDAVDPKAVELKEDNSHGMHRVEVVCAKCHSHLGHLFDDGPADKTGKRFCINSESLNFKK